MTRTPLLLSALCLSAVLSIRTSAQVIQSGTTVTIQQGTSLATNSLLNIGENAQLLNNGTVLLAGDIENNGNRQLSGNFIMNGKSDQLIGGADSFSFTRLTINTSKSVNVNSRVAIIQNLELEKGVINTSNIYPMVFTPSAQNPKETRDAYINGTAIMEYRPVGTSALNFLGAEISSGGDMGNVQVVRVTGNDGVIPIGQNNSIASKWTINSSEAKTEGHDVSFSWLPVFDNNNDPTTLGLFGNLLVDQDKYIKLSPQNRFNIPVSVNAVTEMRTCTRMELDYINRTFTVATGEALTTVTETAKITTYPNPATDHINLLLENYEEWATNVQIPLTDAYGKVISQKIYPLNGNLITIDNLGILSPGIYRLYVSRGQLVQVVNFVKN